MKSSRIALAAALLLAGATPILAQSAAPATAASTAGKARYGSFGVDLAARDTAVDPGDNFFEYANGSWLRTTQIPADRSSWSLWTTLSEDIDDQLRAIITESAASSDPARRRIGDFYAAWMAEAGSEARGTAPLQPYLQRTSAASSRPI